MFTDNNTIKYLNILAPITDGDAVLMVSKCGCSSIAAVVCDRLENSNDYKRLERRTDLRFLGWDYFYPYSKKLNSITSKLFNITAVIRDPLERLVSSYGTLGKELTFINYLEKVCDTIENNSWYNIDRHITLQSIHYDFNLIDRFVWLRDLPRFMKYLGIDYTMINKSTNSYSTFDIPEKLRNKLMLYYKKDYDMLNSISNIKIF